MWLCHQSMQNYSNNKLSKFQKKSLENAFGDTTINIVYFGRTGGGLLLQQIRIIYKVGSMVVYGTSLSLSLFIYSINKKKLKTQNTKKKKRNMYRKKKP